MTPSDTSHLAEDTKDSCGDWMGARTGWGRRDRAAEREADRSKVMRPEWLAAKLHWMFRALLRQGRHMKDYGAILYERVGFVTFSVDGRVLEKLNLAEVLSDNISTLR